MYVGLARASNCDEVSDFDGRMCPGMIPSCGMTFYKDNTFNKYPHVEQKLRQIKGENVDGRTSFSSNQVNEIVKRLHTSCSEYQHAEKCWQIFCCAESIDNESRKAVANQLQKKYNSHS